MNFEGGGCLERHDRSEEQLFCIRQAVARLFTSTTVYTINYGPGEPPLRVLV